MTGFVSHPDLIGGKFRPVPLSPGFFAGLANRKAFPPSRSSLAAAPPEQSGELLKLDEALERLTMLDPRQGKIVELRFFGGLTVEQTADLLGISPKTVKRDWSVAKAWLHRELKASHDGELGSS